MYIKLLGKITSLTQHNTELSSLLMLLFYEEHGITDLKLKVLEVISDHDTITLNTLAKKLFKASANLSVVITEMEEEEFLKRVKSNTDGRIMYIRILPKGTKIYELYSKQVSNIFTKVLGNGDELEKLVEALTNYNQKLNEYFNKNILTSKDN